MPAPARPTLFSSAVTCCDMSLTARRSGARASASARASSTEAAARYAAVRRSRRARSSWTTRATRRCTTTVWPSRLIVSSERSTIRSIA